jgi:hypothetical protein
MLVVLALFVEEDNKRRYDLLRNYVERLRMLASFESERFWWFWKAEHKMRCEHSSSDEDGLLLLDAPSFS